MARPAGRFQPAEAVVQGVSLRFQCRGFECTYFGGNDTTRELTRKTIAALACHQDLLLPGFGALELNTHPV